MKLFNDYTEIKELYEKNKYDIFYENGSTKYEVRHLGSTFYCHDPERNLGMGAVWNFSIDKFYAVEKPDPVVEETLSAVDSSTLDASTQM